MSKLNVWIHCRVTNEAERFLLDYQSDKIMEVIGDNNVRIIGISKEVNAGRDSHTNALDTIKIHARRGDIDAIFVTDKTRLLVLDDCYQEFKLLCEMFDVQIIDLQEFKTLFHHSLFDIFS